MIIGCWNVRGLNDPIKHSALRPLIHQERIALFGLVETRVRDKNKNNVSQLLLRNWSFLYNFDFSCRGRFWVCWNVDTVKVDVFGMSNQAIHVSVTILATNMCFNTSIIYGDNNASLREALLSDIVSCSDGWESTPWILMGDFNAIRNQSDKLGGATTWASTMDKLDTCIREANVFRYALYLVEPMS
jgi:exonuclease III